MKKQSKESMLEELIAPVVEAEGYECVDVTFEKAGKDLSLIHISEPTRPIERYWAG